MAKDYTTTRLLERIRKRAGLPPWGEDGLDDELLERCNDELRDYLTAILQGARTQLKQATLDITVTSALRYDIPSRAIAAGIKMLQGVTTGGQIWFLVELADRDFPSFRTGDFYVEGNQLVFFKAPPVGTLRVTYDRRPSELVLEPTSSANFGATRIIAVLNSTQFTINATVDTPGNSPWDLVRGVPHFDLMSMEIAGSETSGTVTIPAGLPTGLAAGDWLCTPGLSPVVQAPLELHALLAQQTAFTYLDDKGDELAGAAERRRNRLEKDVKQLIAERVQEGRLLINRNGPGFGNGRGWRNSGVPP